MRLVRLVESLTRGRKDAPANERKIDAPFSEGEPSDFPYLRGE